MELISCPTCGRCRIDLFSLAEEVERRLMAVTAPIKVAIMGCVVNGPGKPGGRCGDRRGRRVGLLFKKGEVVRQVPEPDLLRSAHGSGRPHRRGGGTAGVGLIVHKARLPVVFLREKSDFPAASIIPPSALLGHFSPDPQ